MPLVGVVGRKTLRARLAMALVYTCLTIGAVTTLYPFVSMASTGFKGPTDQNDNRLVPAFWIDEGELLAKYRDAKYGGDSAKLTSYATGPEADLKTLGKYRGFLETLPPDQWVAGFVTPGNNVTGRLQDLWIAWLQRKYGSLERLNNAFDELNGSFMVVRTPSERLDQKNWSANPNQKWLDWLEFKAGLPAEYRIPLTSRYLYQQWWRQKAEGQIDRVPPSIRGKAKAFEDLDPPAEPEETWLEFVSTALPKPFLKTGTIEGQWRTQGGGALPMLAFEREVVHLDAGVLRRQFSTQNYRFILSYLVLNSRALANTAIFCILAVLAQLTVNPLAAYALSRFPMKATGRILLFLLATMAFPAEVTMIPSFLLLKDLGLLNTFAALVLPAAASGYMIFLLKGFFDSLPQEIFESGQLDGAPEWVMMLKFAFPLSKPVFGYLALLAFMGAYGAFLYAFLVAQDRKMWTLMVFIYQLQGMAPKAVMMAAVTAAAVPTLMVFLVAQRSIMRGIILPGER